MPDGRKTKPPDGGGFSRRDFLKGVGTAAAAASLVGCVVLPKNRQDAPAPGAVKGAVPVTLRVNGKTHTLQIEPRVTLLDALRERLQITGAKRVCDRGSCGACTVYLDGLPIYACMKLAIDCQGQEIETIESLAPDGEMNALQEEFVAKDALQCGFCTPGFVMSIQHLLKTNPDASLEEVKAACAGNLCRCGAYTRVFEAALAAAKRAKGVG